MIPLAIQAWIGVGIAGCVAGIHSLRAEVRAINVPKLPIKYRRRRGRHHKHWWERSTMEQWSRSIERAQRERVEAYDEPDWMEELREQWQFLDIDEFDARAVGGAGTYDRLPWLLDGPITQEFRRIVGASVWGTPVDVDEWEPVEPVLVVSRG